jgi:two-component system, LytTR family, response regulator
MESTPLNTPLYYADDRAQSRHMERAKVLIIEDERLAAEAVKMLLEREPDVECAGVARDGATAVSMIRRLKPDIIFLDVQIPEIDGFGVIRKIGVENMPVTVFVTAYDRYTLQAFEVHAVDYILKPFDPDRFFAALRWAKRELRLNERTRSQRLTRLVDEVASHAKRRLAIKSAGRVIFVDVDEIDYLEAAGNYVVLHAGAQEYRTRETMNVFEERLSQTQFVRIHRSAIVNRKQIKELRPWFTGEYAVVMKSGKELTLTRSYRDRLPLLLSAE